MNASTYCKQLSLRLKPPRCGGSLQLGCRAGRCRDGEDLAASRCRCSEVASGSAPGTEVSFFPGLAGGRGPFHHWTVEE